MSLIKNKKQINVPQYKKDNFLCDITKYDFWICGVLQVFPPKMAIDQKMGGDGRECLGK